MLMLLLCLVASAVSLPLLCPLGLPRQFADTGCRITGDHEFDCNNRLSPFAEMNQDAFGVVRSRIIQALEGGSGSGCCVAGAPSVTNAQDLIGDALLCAVTVLPVELNNPRLPVDAVTQQLDTTNRQPVDAVTTQQETTNLQPVDAVTQQLDTTNVQPVDPVTTQQLETTNVQPVDPVTARPSRFEGSFRAGQRRIRISRRASGEFTVAIRVTGRSGASGSFDVTARSVHGGLLADNIPNISGCSFNLHTQGSLLVVRQDGSCGLAEDVFADGVYRRVSPDEDRDAGAPRPGDASVPSATSIVGTWRSRFSRVRITRSPLSRHADRVTVSMRLVSERGGRGEVLGRATFANNTLTFEPDSTCRFVGVLTRDILTLTQTGSSVDCGFDEGVSATGEYNK